MAELPPVICAAILRPHTGTHDSDCLPIHIELFGDHHRQKVQGALSQLLILRDDGGSAVRRNADEVRG